MVKMMMMDGILKPATATYLKYFSRNPNARSVWKQSFVHSFIHPRIHPSILFFLLTFIHYLFLYFRLFSLFRIYLFATNLSSTIHILFLKNGINSFRNVSFRDDVKHSLKKELYEKRNTRRQFFFKLLMLKFRLRFKKCSFVQGHSTLPFSVYLPTRKILPIRTVVVRNWHRSTHKPTYEYTESGNPNPVRTL